VAGALVFAASLLYTLPAAAHLLDDHFMHVAWGRQLLAGRLPLRDMVEPGLPLQAALSAAAEWVFGHRLLSEAAIISVAFATAAVLTFGLARRASGSIWIGVLAAVLQIAITPRSYSYPKILLYATGIALLWRYIDRPSTRRSVVMAAALVVAFYFRHDHGLFLGLAAVLVLLFRHAGDWRVGLQRATVLGTACVVGVAPYLLFVQGYTGVDRYLGDLLAFAAREHQQNRLDAWPSWPLSSFDDIAARDVSGATGVTIGVRWSNAAPDERRREAAARYRLRVADDGPLESGRYVLTDISPENSLALINDPAIEDTSGLDRATGLVAIPGLRLGGWHAFPGLDDARAAAALLLYTFAAFVMVTLFALSRRPRPNGPLGEWERMKVGAAALVAVVAGLAFVREPLEVRVPDAIVAPLVLAAWCAGRWLVDGSRPVSRRRRAGRIAVAILLLVAIARGVAVVGAVSSRLEGVGVWPGTTPAAAWTRTWRRLSTTPPFDAWDAAGSAKYRAVRYVRACTPAAEPLLVLWFAPDLYYYADRPFAGRLGFYMEGYWASGEHESANLDRIERERPVLALSEVRHEASDLRTYPKLAGYLADFYRPIGKLPDNDGSVIRVLARADRMPTSTDPDLGWPCFR
jgi:hypothetical protein